MIPLVKVNTILNIVLAIFTDYERGNNYCDEENISIWTSFRTRRDAVFELLENFLKGSPLRRDELMVESRNWPEMCEKQVSMKGGQDICFSVFKSEVDRAKKRSNLCVSQKCYLLNAQHDERQICVCNSNVFSPQYSWSPLEYTYALLRIVKKNLAPCIFMHDSNPTNEKFYADRDILDELFVLQLPFLEKEEKFAIGFYISFCKLIIPNYVNDKINMASRVLRFLTCAEEMSKQAEKTGKEYETLKESLIENFVVPIVMMCEMAFNTHIVDEWKNLGAPSPDGTVQLRNRLDSTLKDIVVEEWIQKCVKKVDPNFEMATYMIDTVEKFSKDRKQLFLHMYKDVEMRRRARRINPYAWKKMVEKCDLKQFLNEPQEPFKNFKVL